MSDMTSITIRERVLTDDVLHIVGPGYVFKGGYVAMLEYHTFRNANSDDAHVRRFRTLDAAAKYLRRHYTDEEISDAGIDFA